MTSTHFPPGRLVIKKQPFDPSLYQQVDKMMADGRCPDGRFEVENHELRLTCLIHKSSPHLAGWLEQGEYGWMPIKEFVLRATQLSNAHCSLICTEPTLVLLAAVHFRNRPELQASTELLDLEHVLDTLAKDQQDAALALERDDHRTLLFLQKGIPARIYFADPSTAPQSGDIRTRFLEYAFQPGVKPGKVEVFKRLKIAPDLDAGTSLSQLTRASKPPPPISVQVRSGGKIALQRSFMPPTMTIGRDPLCEIRLDNLSVSRKHARITWEQGHFIAEDLNSSNGTSLNGNPITKQIITPQDRLTLGKFEITLVESGRLGHIDATIIMPSCHQIPGYLVGKDVAIPLGQTLTIGKAPGVDVVVRGFRVKPLHAKIKMDTGNTLRVECLSNAHVLINGKKTRSAKLHFGDKLVVGRTHFTVTPNIQTEPPGL